MKNFHLFIAAIVALCASAHPQSFSFGPQDLKIGDDIRTQQCDTMGISEGGAGSSMTWTIDAMILDSNAEDTKALDPSLTPFSDSFPAATIALSQTANVGSFVYIKATVDSSFLLGIADSSLLIKFSNPMLTSISPFNYGDSLRDSFSIIRTTSASAMTYTTKISGTISVLHDGKGKLVLPWVTFNNAQRFRSLITESDSIVAGGVSIPSVTISTRTYGWRDPSMPRGTEFSISYTTTSTLLASNTVKSVRYASPVTGLAVKAGPSMAARSALRAGAVSSRETITVSIPPHHGSAALLLYSMDGRLARTIDLGAAIGALTLAGGTGRINRGAYVYSLKDDEGVLGQGKITIK